MTVGQMAGLLAQRGEGTRIVRGFYACLRQFLSEVVTSDHCRHKVRRYLTGVGHGELNEGGANLGSSEPVKLA